MALQTILQHRTISYYAALILILSLVLDPSLAASASAPMASAPSLVVQDLVPRGGGNPVVGLVTYVKDSIVKTADSCSQLWKNHGECKAIRKKQAEHRRQVGERWEMEGLYQTESKQQIRQRLAQIQGGVSFADYLFLQKGKEDRGKVMNVAFLMFGAPRFLPYALMFNPDMLPSPFTNENKHSPYATETPAQSIARERSAAFIQALAKIEQQAKAGNRGGLLSSLNIFGKKKQQSKHQQMVKVYDGTRRTLSSHSTPQMLLAKLEPMLYRSGEDFSRPEKRLCQIPACIVQGMGNVISGKAAALLSSLQPNFMQRGKVVAHLRKITECDDFLVQADVDLNSIPPRILVETCGDRMVGGPDSSPEELRQRLKQWLQLAVTEPANKVAASTSPDGTANLFFNSNVARLALMGHYAAEGARGFGRAEPSLPQLLLSGSKVNGNDASASVESGKGPSVLGWKL